MGGVTAVVGIVLFLAVHAVLIVPVLPTPLRGTAAIAVGVAVAWAYEEALAAGTLRGGPIGGAVLGALFWVILLPVTTVGALVRVAGIRSAMGIWELVLEVGIAVGLGALLGWLATHRRRGVLAFAVAVLSLVFLTGGPLPVTASGPAIGLLVGLLPVFALSGLVMAAIRLAVGPTPAPLPARREGSTPAG